MYNIHIQFPYSKILLRFQLHHCQLNITNYDISILKILLYLYSLSLYYQNKNKLIQKKIQKVIKKFNFIFK